MHGDDLHSRPRRRPRRRPRVLPHCRSWRIVTEPLPPLHAGRIASLGICGSFAGRTHRRLIVLAKFVRRVSVNLQPGSRDMKSPRWVLGAATMLSFAIFLSPTRLSAQGVTTGAISGTVTDAAGKPVESAQVQIINRSTGYRTGAMTRANGYYYVQGLEAGGPYTVSAKRIGYQPVERNGVTVSLSSTTRVALQLSQAAVTLSAVTVSGSAQASTFSQAHQGVSTEVTDSLIRRIPQINRNITDLVKLTPQVSSPATGGPTAGGQYNRYNNFTIDGANQNDRFNLNSSGGLPGGAGRI